MIRRPSWSPAVVVSLALFFAVRTGAAGDLRMVTDILAHTLHFDVQFGSAEAAAQHKLYFFMRRRVKGT